MFITAQANIFPERRKLYVFVPIHILL
jgi:hypothetical protein